MANSPIVNIDALNAAYKLLQSQFDEHPLNTVVTGSDGSSISIDVDLGTSSDPYKNIYVENLIADLVNGDYNIPVNTDSIYLIGTTSTEDGASTLYKSTSNWTNGTNLWSEGGFYVGSSSLQGTLIDVNNFELTTLDNETTDTTSEDGLDVIATRQWVRSFGSGGGTYKGVITNSEELSNVVNATGEVSDEDYFFYAGESSTSTTLPSGDTLEVSSGSFYKYVFEDDDWVETSYTWNALHAVEDIVSLAETNTEVYTIYALDNFYKLLGTEPATENIVADLTKSINSIQITQIDGTNPNLSGNNYSITNNIISAGTNTNDDSDTYWALYSNGSAFFKNASFVGGNVISTGVNANTLITVDRQASTIGDYVSKTFDTDLWSVSTAFNSMIETTTASRFIMAGSEQGISGTYNEETLTAVGLSTNGIYPTTSLSNNTTSGALTFGIYSLSSTIGASARTRVMVARKYNYFDYPVYLYQYGYLSTTMSGYITYATTIYGDSGTSYAYNMGEGGSIKNRMMLPPDYSIYAQGYDSAAWLLWNDTLTYRLETGPSTGHPPISTHLIAEYTSGYGSEVNSFTYEAIGTVEVPSNASYWKVFGIKGCYKPSSTREYYARHTVRLGSSSTITCTLLEGGSETYAEVPDSLKGTTVTVYLGRTRYSSSSTYQTVVGLVTVAFYDREEPAASRILLTTESGNQYNLAAGFSTSEADDWCADTFSYSSDEISYNSADNLEKVSGDSIYAYLEDAGFVDFGEFDSSQNSVATKNSTTVRSLMYARKYTNYWQLYSNSNSVTYAKKGSNDDAGDAPYGVYDSASISLYPVEEQAHIETANIYPLDDGGDYNIGEEDNPFSTSYINQMYGNVNAEGTSYTVWGAVFN